MITYVDYDFYLNTYLGQNIAESDFPRLALNASVTINLLTYNRAAPIIAAAEEETADADKIEKIKLATCAVAEVLQKIEGNGGAVQSESVGRHSVTYFAPKTQEGQAFEAARLYLWDTGLMYRGFTADER